VANEPEVTDFLNVKIPYTQKIAKTEEISVSTSSVPRFRYFELHYVPRNDVAKKLKLL